MSQMCERELSDQYFMSILSSVFLQNMTMNYRAYSLESALIPNEDSGAYLEYLL